MIPTRQKLTKWGLPIAVSAAAIAYLGSAIDFSGVAERMTLRSASILVPALIFYGAWNLLLDAFTLKRVMHANRSDFTLITAARVKAASYIPGLIHYALGAGSLTVLLQRRSGVGLGKSAGIVMLIMMFDLGTILSLVAVGATLTSSTNAEMRIGVIVGVVAVIAGGLTLLRASFSLGPLDKLRNLELFHTARTIPARDLVELALLRLAFVLSLEFLGWAALYAFEIEVPIGPLLVNFSAVALAGLLPAVAGIGPSQIAMVKFFGAYGSPENLLACSVGLSAGMILLRSLIGIGFAREFSREAYSAVLEGSNESNPPGNNS